MIRLNDERKEIMMNSLAHQWRNHKSIIMYSIYLNGFPNSAAELACLKDVKQILISLANIKNINVFTQINQNREKCLHSRRILIGCGSGPLVLYQYLNLQKRFRLNM